MLAGLGKNFARQAAQLSCDAFVTTTMVNSTSARNTIVEEARGAVMAGKSGLRKRECSALLAACKLGTKDLSAEQVVKWSREHMANYKIPRRVVFHEALPRNASGKILKFELKP